MLTRKPIPYIKSVLKGEDIGWNEGELSVDFSGEEDFSDLDSSNGEASRYSYSGGYGRTVV